MRASRPVAQVLAVALLLTLSSVCRSADAPRAGEVQHMAILGPGDSVSLQIFGEPEIPSVYVGDDGTLNVPMAGNVPVAGVSPVEAAARVAKALKDGGYFVDPHVTIIVTQPRSQLVSVVGEVQSAGRYPISPRTTIVDLLAQAGGVKETASEVGYLLRTDAQGHATRYPVKLNGLGENPMLLGGDSLVVPRAENYYVYGEVANPGTYRIEPNMSVIQGIARAGGINERGSERRIQVKRLGKNGEYQVIHVKPGDLIHPDDIIRVKESIF